MGLTSFSPVNNSANISLLPFRIITRALDLANLHSKE